jgi:hypothetical protein
LRYVIFDPSQDKESHVGEVGEKYKKLGIITFEAVPQIV